MLRPGRAEITVVVTVACGANGIERTLAALATQSAADDRFDVLIAAAGDTNVAEAMSAAAALRPGLRTRVVQRSNGAEAELRNSALWAVAAPFVTFLQAGDTAVPGFIDALLEAAGPNLVPAAPLGAEPLEPTDGPSGSGPVDPAAQPEVLAVADGRAYSSAVARDVGFTTGLAATLERDFSVRYWSRRDVRVRPLSAAAAGVLRPARPGRLVTDLHDRGAVSERVAALVSLGRELERAPSNEVREVIGHHQRAVADDINRYLRNHPEAHPGLLAELRQTGARHVSYSAINTGLAETLVVSFCFPPVVDTSGIVMAKRVQQYGEVVDVISNNLNTARVLFDDGAVRIAEEYVDTHTPVKATRVFTRSWPAIVEFAEQGYAAAAAREAEHGPYRLVRSRAMWIAAHALAGLLRARRESLRWSAEMSDPLSRDVHGQLREAPLPSGDPLVIELRDAARFRGRPLPALDHLGVFVELMTYALADEIVFTNPRQRDYMLSYCEVPALAERARAIAVIRPQPTLPPRSYETSVELDLAEDRVHLAYFGNLYENRSLADALGALADLPAPWRRRVQLSVFTSTPDLVEGQVAASALGDVIRVQPYLSYLEFLGVLGQFDCLIIEDALTSGSGHDVNPYLPSKWADYRGSGTAVWGIIEPGSPLSDEELTYRSQHGDRDGAAATLRQIIADRAKHAPGELDQGASIPK